MRRARTAALLALVLILSVLTPSHPGQASSLSQEVSARQKAQTLVARMSPEEKVGQLLLISFKGTEITEGTQIYDLVTRYHIGGVALRAENDNFTGPENTVTEAFRLNTGLQQIVWDSYQAAGANNTNYVPLLIGIQQEGDLYPNDTLINGVTPLPDLMSLGATWDANLSRQTGAAMGKELSAMGFNLFLGPSLDVLDEIPAEGSEDLGTRTFGGDPFWVGQMGQAYIEGLHEGSQGQLAVIARHFPGRGSSDRPSETEVATVRKSLEQLKQVELAPFFAVTGAAPDAAKTTDGLLLSHIRYQGFQNNIRATTSPVSFDRNALDLILKLPELDKWRQNGGVVVSDDLGSPALKRFYQSTGQTFDARQVARNAFMTGSDLLYLNNFTGEGDPDSFTTIIRTINLFVARYREDRTFAERVDASVGRLLEMKYRLYPEFRIESVLPTEEELVQVGSQSEISYEVARRAVTLISPSADEMETVLPRPPGLNDRIVFITDVRYGRQCSRCLDQTPIAVDALQNTVLRLYGPQAGGQVTASRLTSYTFSDLQYMLNGTTEVSQIEQDLRQSGWIVFAMMNIERNRVETQALRRFLSERPDLFRSRRVIVFAFNAPYYLDATDISKLTAYYGMYSKGPAFVDAAARILFQELNPAGALPVNVPGVGYNIIETTAPDPNQVIPLFLDTLEMPTPIPGEQNTPAPTPVPVFKVGDSIPLRTGVILDHNGYPVPDGTVARFLFTLGGDMGAVSQIEATTAGGVARAGYRIQTPGLLEIRVVSDPAATSQLLRLDVSETGGVITPISPTIEPTNTPSPTVTITPSPTPTPEPSIPQPARPLTGDWLLAMMVTWASAAAIFGVGYQRFSLRWGFRLGISAAIGGLLAYLYFAFARLINEESARSVERSNILLMTFFGILVGVIVAMIWKRWMENRARSHPDRPVTGPKSPVN